jgi:hypothetical protein
MKATVDESKAHHRLLSLVGSDGLREKSEGEKEKLEFEREKAEVG